jgi:uncharacterized phage-associated protein
MLLVGHAHTDSTAITLQAPNMSARAPYDARAVANLLLDAAERRSMPLTQLSLYKIVYFAHGWYLVHAGGPLILHDFEAWRHGPVVKVLRDEFDRFKARPITVRASKLDIFSGMRTAVEPNLAEGDKQFVLATFEAYHIHDAWRLSEMTHESGSPWDLLWNSEAPIGRLGLRIKDQEIREYFERLPRRFSVS